MAEVLFLKTIEKRFQQHFLNRIQPYSSYRYLTITTPVLKYDEPIDKQYYQVFQMHITYPKGSSDGAKNNFYK